MDLIKLTLPKKPKFGQPCNNCGLCCVMEVCKIGKMILGDAQKAPCPLLMQVTNKSTGEIKLVCDLVVREKLTGIEPIIQNALAIGKGCDAAD